MSLQLLGQIFAYIGKFCLTITFAVIYTITCEIYPSEVRGSGLSICSFAARLSGFLAPFVLSLDQWVVWLPGTLFGVFGIVAGVASYFLPETRGKSILSTIYESEQVYS